MNEPLKGKERVTYSFVDGEPKPFGDGFHKKDIASAVAWLKEQLRIHARNCQSMGCHVYLVKSEIDEAFADVIGEVKP